MLKQLLLSCHACWDIHVAYFIHVYGMGLSPQEPFLAWKMTVQHARVVFTPEAVHTPHPSILLKR